MAAPSLKRVDNKKFYKRVRRDGKWITIDTRTGKEVTKELRIKHKAANKERWVKRGKEREARVGKFIRENITERLFDSDEDDPNHPVKGGKLTQRQSRLRYEKEVRNRDTGKDDAEMTPKQQKRALKISKKRNLTDLKVNKGTSEKESSDKKKKKKSSSGGREKAIRRAYGNISDKRVKQLLGRAATQRELEES